MGTESKRKAQRQRKREQNKELILLTGDAVTTATWVILSSLFGEAAEALSDITGLKEFVLAVAITIIGLLVMGPFCGMFGGALFNPVHNAAFMCAGKGTLKLNVARMVAQVIGALAGSYAAVSLTPDTLKDHFPKLPGGLQQGVQLEVGVAVELLLGVVLNFVVLYSIDAQHKLVGYWSPVMATIVLIFIGSYFTGPSMNPAVAYSWYHHYQGHSWAEQIAVYWLAPFVGAMLGGLLYRWWNKGAAAAAPARHLPLQLKAAAAAAAGDGTIKHD